MQVKNLDLYGSGGEGMLTAEQVRLQLINHIAQALHAWCNFKPG